MPDLKFDGEVIPVTHLLPDDVLVFTAPAYVDPAEVDRIRQVLQERYPAPRTCFVMHNGLSLAVNRDGVPIPVGES